MTVDRVAALGRGLERLVRDRQPGAANVAVTVDDRCSAGRSCENWPATVSWNDGEGCHQRRVMIRLDPPGTMFTSSRQAEFSVLDAVARAGLPAPMPLWVDQSGEHLPGPSVVTAFVEGEANIKVLSDEDPLNLGLAGRAELARQMAATLARLHGLDRCVVRELFGPHSAGDELDRALAGWTELLRKSTRAPEPEVALALRWLRRNRPEARVPVLVHGDWKPDNFLVRSGAISAVLDWEMAHLGNPIEDLAWWLSPPLRGWIEVPGRFSADDFQATYAAISGIQPSAEELRYWRVVTMIKMVTLAMSSATEFAEGSSDQPRSALNVRRFERLLLESMESS